MNFVQSQCHGHDYEHAANLPNPPGTELLGATKSLPLSQPTLMVAKVVFLRPAFDVPRTNGRGRDRFIVSCSGRKSWWAITQPPSESFEPRGFRAAGRGVDRESIHLGPYDRGRRAQMRRCDGKEANTAGPRGSDRKGSHARALGV